jgi:hypothetical protein
MPSHADPNDNVEQVHAEIQEQEATPDPGAQ